MLLPGYLGPGIPQFDSPVEHQPAGSGAKPAGISLGDLPGMSKKPEAAAPAKKAARKGKVPPPAAEEPAAGE